MKNIQWTVCGLLGCVSASYQESRMEGADANARLKQDAITVESFMVDIHFPDLGISIDPETIAEYLIGDDGIMDYTEQDNGMDTEGNQNELIPIQQIEHSGQSGIHNYMESNDMPSNPIQNTQNIPVSNQNIQSINQPVVNSHTDDIPGPSHTTSDDARPKMTRAILDPINPATCSTADSLFYWFGLPIRKCDLSYALYFPAGYYLSIKGVDCPSGSKTGFLKYKNTQSVSPAKLNIVRDDYSRPVLMDMSMRNRLGASGIICQDIRCLEYILSAFASPLFRGEYFHVITGVHMRERKEDEADIYSLKKPRKALDRRASVIKSEDKIVIPFQLPENTAQIYTKTFFAPVLVREGNKSVLCILLIHFERPPLKKEDISSDMSDDEKNEVYDIVRRPHKLVSATLIRFDGIENESEQPEECKSIIRMLCDAINTTEYKKAKEYFESVDWNDKALDTLSIKSTGESVTTKQSKDKDTQSEELVLVPEEHAESHFFIRSDPENIEKCHMLHEYNRDVDAYVLVLKRKGTDKEDIRNTEATALMFLNPGKQFNITEIKRKRGGRANNPRLVLVDMLWYTYKSIWKMMKPNQEYGIIESYWMVPQQAYYTPDWCRDRPKEYEAEMERCSKERVKKIWEDRRENSAKHNRKRSEQKRAIAIAKGRVPGKGGRPKKQI